MKLNSLALQPTKFVHFVNPATGELVYEPQPDVFPEGHERAGQANPNAGEPNLDKPVGVRVYGPGSKEYRHAQTTLTNEAIERKRKKVTAELIEQNAVELLARTTYEFVNFDYEGDGATPENNRKFYRDPEYVHFREQVQAEMGDHGGFLQSA
jgi:hypothetical protein